MNINKGTIRQRFKKILKPLIFIIIVGGIICWYKFSSVLVETFKITPGNMTSVVMGTGTLDTKVKIILSSKISGRIETIFTDQGFKITKGQLLATLDDEPLKLQSEVAKAQLITAKSTLNKLKTELDYTKAVLDNAMIHYNRAKKLVAQDVISQKNLDNATRYRGTATASYNNAQEAIIEAENKVFEAKEISRLRKSQLDETQITAPFDGLITKKIRDPGDIVIPGSAIFKLISTKIIWISAWVEETNLAKIKVGQSAKIIFRSEPEHSYPGKVTRIGNQVDIETREFIVDVTIDKLPINWAIGQRAEVYIDTEKKENVLFVPEKYINWQKNATGVFVDDNSHSFWQQVETGIRGNGMIEIIKGIKKDDTILIPADSKHQLFNNARIKIQ
jgi:HlyD family secretion protein